jgi:hypothetical protein
MINLAISISKPAFENLPLYIYDYDVKVIRNAPTDDHVDLFIADDSPIAIQIKPEINAFAFYDKEECDVIRSFNLSELEYYQYRKEGK